MATLTTSPVVIDTTCNVVYLRGMQTGFTGPVSISITSSGNGSNETFEASSVNGAITASFEMATDGVVQVIATFGDGQSVTNLAVSSCSVDCCIAKLVEEAIKCTCKCDKCKEELDRAEKVFLLLQAATHSAAQGNLILATEQYAKAKDLCIAVCACGC